MIQVGSHHQLNNQTRHAATINVWITWYVPTTARGPREARDVSATDGWYAVAAASHHDNHHHAKPIDDGRRPANDGWRLSIVATYDGWRLSIVAIIDGRFQDWSRSQLVETRVNRAMGYFTNLAQQVSKNLNKSILQAMQPM